MQHQIFREYKNKTVVILKLLALALVQLTIFAFVWTSFASAADDKTVYRSEADELVTVRKISLLPIFDNVGGIYSRPIEIHLNDSLKKNHHFELVDQQSAGAVLTPEEIEDNINTAKQVAQGLNSDAFVSIKLIKGPAGISIRMSLFLTKDAKLFARQEVSGIKRLDIEGLKKQSEDLLNKLLRALPYEGVVMSRQGTRVTMNLGARDGIVPDQVVSVVQIIKLNRHPKFNFLINTEKEILGKIRILKIDDTLSFGRIVTEKEAGSIQVNAKISGIDSVSYNNTDSLSDTKVGIGALQDRPDHKTTYGDKPTEWVPQKNPKFGSIGARLGIGRFKESIKSTTTLNSDAPFYPFVIVEGEVWLTPDWSLHTSIRQGIISTDNPAGGSKLSRSLSNYELLGGYNFRMGPGVWSPKIELLGGFSTYRLQTDKTNDAAITSKSYSGLKFGASGYYPIRDNSPYAIGAQLFFYFDPSVSEDPGSSGSDKNSINQFGLFVEKRLKVNLRAKAAIDFELYSSDFSGGTVTSASQRYTNMSAGLAYLF
jgi:hypothetical protein